MVDSATKDRIVLEYLQKRGYRQAEQKLAQELQRNSQSLDQFVFDSQLLDAPMPITLVAGSGGKEETASAVIQSFHDLQRFIEDSLDLYKSELQSILYPLFVHVYLDLIGRGYQSEAVRFFDSQKAEYQQQFPADMLQLSSVTDAMHVLQNPVASMFRSNKYTLLMSSYAFELLLSFLMDSHFITLLKLLNQFINIKVYSTKPVQSMRKDAAQVGITGHTSQEIQSVNEHQLFTGRQPYEPHFQEILDKQLQRHGISSASTSDLPAAPKDDSVPAVPKTNNDIMEMIAELKDVRSRVKLSKHHALPSAVTYTFHNTFNRMTSCAFSQNNKMIATGFADSYIRLWSVTKEPLRSLKSAVEYSAADFENVDTFMNGCEEKGDFSKRLIGHAGPVYDMCFSANDKYLLSGSEDGSARLWSMNTFTNVVAYTGHNYPIWSVDFGPESYYFATASHDRTARVWCCERPNALRVFAGHLSDVECVKFHPNSNYIATSSADRTVRLWDVHRGKCVRLFTSSLSGTAQSSSIGGSLSGLLPGHPSRTATILKLAMSPDGQLIASGGDDGSIVVWDLASGRVLKRYNCTTKKHQKPAATFTGNDTRTEGDRLEEVTTTTGSSAIYSMDFSADSAVLAVGFANGHVRVYEINKEGDADGVLVEKTDLLSDFCTKRTPVHGLKFTNKNLLLTAGPFIPY